MYCLSKYCIINLPFVVTLRGAMTNVMKLVGIGLLVLLATSPIGCTTYHIGSVITSPADDAADAQKLYQEVALPTVMVRTDFGLGSGVVFGDGSLVLTAAHVICHHDVSLNDNGDRVEGPTIMEPAVVFKNEGFIPYLSGTEVVKFDEKLDLAILRVAMVYPYAKAVFATKDPYLYEKCWVSGHPHGITNVLITEGRVQALWDGGFLVHSSPSTFGNSGGPIWVLEDGKYVVMSIVQRVYVEGMGVAVNHMGLAALPSEVRKFIE